MRLGLGQGDRFGARWRDNDRRHYLAPLFAGFEAILLLVTGSILLPTSSSISSSPASPTISHKPAAASSSASFALMLYTSSGRATSRPWLNEVSDLIFLFAMLFSRSKEGGAEAPPVDYTPSRLAFLMNASGRY